MKIKYLVIGHGLIYYKVEYMNRRSKIVMHIADYKSCIKTIDIIRTEFDYIMLTQKLHYILEEWKENE